MAPIQVIICPIVMKSADQTALLEYANEIKYLLKQKGVRADTDCRMNYTPGWKFNHWEQKGVPLRLEVGGGVVGIQWVVGSAVYSVYVVCAVYVVGGVYM